MSLVQVGDKFRVRAKPRRNGATRSDWYAVYQCHCGARFFMRTASFGRTQSCGCFYERRRIAVTAHGLSQTVEYQTWVNVVKRCTDPTRHDYPRYGGRGITVCDRWLGSCEAFVEDMGPRPEGYSIERIDNELGYSPDNCRWASRRDQCRNRRSNRTITLDGVTRCLTEWAEHVGVYNGETIAKRLRRGWGDREAVFGRDST